VNRIHFVFFKNNHFNFWTSTAAALPGATHGAHNNNHNCCSRRPVGEFIRMIWVFFSRVFFFLLTVAPTGFRLVVPCTYFYYICSHVISSDSLFSSACIQSARYSYKIILLSKNMILRRRYLYRYSATYTRL